MARAPRLTRIPQAAKPTPKLPTSSGANKPASAGRKRKKAPKRGGGVRIQPTKKSIRKLKKGKTKVSY